MNTGLEPSTIGRIVIWSAFALGVLLGAVGQATRFCIRGAIADWVEAHHPGRFVAWFLAIGVGAVAVQILLAGGLLDAARTLAWTDRFAWVSYLVGGTLFGYGMILAGGCPQRCLVKAASGNLKAAVALGLVAIAAAMTLRGLFAGVRVTYLDAWSVSLGRPQDLGSLLGGALGASPGAIRWTLAVLALASMAGLAWKLRARVRRADLVGGVAVGLLLAAALYLTGHVGYLAEHPETLEPAWLGTQSNRPEGLSFSAPMAHLLDLLTLWTDKSLGVTFGVMLALGTLLGAFASARLRGEFRLETFRSPRELGEHAAGAVLMGFGGVSALGCSVGNGVTGLALLSAGALLATGGVVLGAWLALNARARRAAGHGAAALSAQAR